MEGIHIPFVQAVQCNECAKLFESSSNDFYTVWGNITTGLSGGLIGDAFDEHGKLRYCLIFCARCFLDLITHNSRWSK